MVETSSATSPSPEPVPEAVETGVAAGAAAVASEAEEEEAEVVGEGPPGEEAGVAAVECLLAPQVVAPAPIRK